MSSSHLKCKFFDPLGNEVVVRASYESSSVVRCVAPSQSASVDPNAVDYATATSPCYASAVRVSNTGNAGSWSAANSAPTAQFFYCDLYVDSSGASTTNADGSALKPFDTIQRALQSALIDVQSASDTHIGREFALANPSANALLNADVVRLAPGAYAGAGAVRLVAEPRVLGARARRDGARERRRRPPVHRLRGHEPTVRRSRRAVVRVAPPRRPRRRRRRRSMSRRRRERLRRRELRDARRDRWVGRHRADV